MSVTKKIASQTLTPRETVATPESFLFMSVILQALLDAITEEGLVPDKRKSLNKERALAWFYASIGVTASDFEEVCDLANIDPTQMKTFAIDVITSNNKKHMREKINLLFSRRTQ
jgi:hypothetical protein